MLHPGAVSSILGFVRMNVLNIYEQPSVTFHNQIVRVHSFNRRSRYVSLRAPCLHGRRKFSPGIVCVHVLRSDARSQLVSLQWIHIEVK